MRSGATKQPLASSFSLWITTPSLVWRTAAIGWVAAVGCSAWTITTHHDRQFRRVVSLQRVHPSTPSLLGNVQQLRPYDRTRIVLFHSNGEDAYSSVDAELIVDGPAEDDADDWIPDQIHAQAARQQRRIYAERIVEDDDNNNNNNNNKNHDPLMAPSRDTSSPYTEEEEEVIAAMGGKTGKKREIGYLGDSTLSEIAMDYSVPVCYLADVLCMWGVPVPINTEDRLGDLVTGEQAFAILEAVNSLDVGALHDRYSNTNLLQLCANWEIPIQDAFSMAMKEEWSLPFGVHTCLRVEQEDELLRVLAGEKLAGGDD